MKRVILTGLLVIGAACLILGCGKKESSPAEDRAVTEQTEGREEENEPEEQEEPKDQEEDAQDEAAQEDAPEADEAETGQKTIGSESADAHRVLLTNHTGEAITAFSVKASSDAEFPENMMEADLKIGNEETVCLYYAPSQAEGAQSSSGKMLRTTYEFSVTNESGREIRIAGLMFDDIQEAELCFEDGVGFIRYVSVNSGEEISTKEMALSLQAQ